MADKNNLLILFENPSEPIYTRKSNNRIFSIPPQLLDDEARENVRFLRSQQNDVALKVIQVNELDEANIPDLSNVGFEKVNKFSNFSVINQRHQAIAAELTEIFLSE
jgi:hypothetical protein